MKWPFGISMLGLLLLLIFPVPAMAQRVAVSGVVTDATTGEPLPLVNIQIKGTMQGTVTDGNGRYTLHVPGPEAVLRFFYTGYAEEERVVGTQTTIDVQLGESREEIEQVVVTGYQTIEKDRSTGS